MNFKIILKWVGMALAALGSLAFIVYVLANLRWQDLATHLNPRNGIALVLATLVYMTLIPISALAWQRILHGLGNTQRFPTLLTIVSVTQAAKYLPGNVGQHVGRIGLSLASGIPIAIISASMAYEICLLLLADLLIGLASGVTSGPGLGFLLGRTGTASSPWAVVAVGALAVFALCLSPLLARLLSKLVEVLFKHRIDHSRLPGALAPLVILQVIGLYAIAMLLMGLSLWIIATALHTQHASDYALVTAAFTLAWAVGFVTPGAPAGLGIREALMLFMLSPTFGAADTSLITLALRIVTTAGDMGCLLAGLPYLHRLRRRRRTSLEHSNLS